MDTSSIQLLGQPVAVTYLPSLLSTSWQTQKGNVRHLCVLSPGSRTLNGDIIKREQKKPKPEILLSETFIYTTMFVVYINFFYFRHTF